MAAIGARFQSRSRRSSWATSATRGAARALGVATLAAALALTGTPAHAAGPSEGEVERLYVEGQQRLENKDYRGAADSWTRLLSTLPESGDNQAIRESVIINVLDAHLKAYNQLVDEGGKKDISHLRAGKETLDKYYAEFKTTHGGRVGISAAVQDKAAELEAALEEAEKNEAAAATDPGERKTDTQILPEGTAAPADNGDKKVIVLQPQSNGTGLIVGGAVLAALGAGTLVMIPVGSIMGQNAEKDYEAATNPADQDDADQRGSTANVLLITGAVATPLLWGGAAAMIFFGIRARRRASEEQQRAIQNVRAAPVVGPRFSGFSLSGRF